MQSDGAAGAADGTWGGGRLGKGGMGGEEQNANDGEERTAVQTKGLRAIPRFLGRCN